jgi:nitrate/nitrite transporter NarK
MLGVPFVARVAEVDTITALLCLATFGHGCFMVNYLAFTSEVSARKTSTAAGILGGAGSLAGAGFMLLVGEIVEATHSFALVFALAGLMPLVALAGMWFGTRETKSVLS